MDSRLDGSGRQKKRTWSAARPCPVRSARHCCWLPPPHWSLQLVDALTAGSVASARSVSASVTPDAAEEVYGLKKGDSTDRS